MTWIGRVTRRQGVLLILLASGFLAALLGLFGARLVEARLRDQLEDRLRAGVTSTRKAIDEWFVDRGAEMRAWSSSATFARVLTPAPNARDEAGVVLDEMCHARDCDEALIVGADGAVLLRTGGGFGPLTAEERVAIAWAQSGGPYVTSPFKAGGRPRIAAAAAGPGGAALLVRLRPEGSLSTVLRNNRPGQSGETYLFDGNGRMLSESRFDDELRAAGLITDRSLLELTLRDPGKDTRGAHVRPDPSWPLTRMAASAITGAGGLDLDGYRDYRGVTVVGAWDWWPDRRIGLAFEIDSNEALAPLLAVRRVLWAGMLLFVLTAVAAAWFLIRERRVERRRARAEAERVASERALRDSEARLRLLADNLPNGMVYQIRRDPDGKARFLHVSAAIERLNGLTVDAVVRDPGQLYGQIVADDRDRLAAAERESIAGLTVFNSVVRLRRADGELRWMQFCSAPRRLDDGAVVWDGIELDITDTRRAELEEQRLIGELRARNAEMEQFVYTVSHDLKSPLVTIQGFLGSVIDDLAHDQREHVDGDLGRIGSAAERMGSLLDHLLELSRVGRIGAPPAPVPLSEVVADAIAQVEGRLRQRGAEVVVAPALPCVQGDRGRLTQVFQNLIENAVKYAGDRPCPHIEIGARPAREPSDTRPTAEVFVKDDGVGIDPRHFTRVFGLFDKLDPKSDGTGFGLALVKRIVEFHGGRVWVESEGAGCGSTFVVALPLDQVAAR